MNNVMDRLLKEVELEVAIKAIHNMIEFGISKEQILTKYSEEEYNAALKQLKTE